MMKKKNNYYSSEFQINNECYTVISVLNILLYLKKLI